MRRDAGRTLRERAASVSETTPWQEYLGHVLVRRITTGSSFRFQHRLLFIAPSLAHHDIGLAETDDESWSIFFNIVLLAKLNERDSIVRGEPVQWCYPWCRFTRLPISPVAHACSEPGFHKRNGFVK